MSRALSLEPLSTWISSTYNAHNRRVHEHCFEIRPKFRIPGAGVADLLTVRHSHSASPGGPDLFAVGLWTFEEGMVNDLAVDAVQRRIQAFQACYAELLEQAEIQGFSALHRISVCGNLVGASVKRSALIDLLSNWGTSMAFWTWKSVASGIELAPYYGRQPGMTAPRSQMKDLLDHLPWEDSAEPLPSESGSEDLRHGAAEKPSCG